MTGAELTIWHLAHHGLHFASGFKRKKPGFSVSPGGSVEKVEPGVYAGPVSGQPGYFFEATNTRSERGVVDLAVMVASRVLDGEREVMDMAEELAERYEEINLLYTISEILGSTIRLKEAAQRIVEEVGAVVRSRRATIFVFDEDDGLLRPVAGLGVDAGLLEPISIHDTDSISAAAFRDRRIVSRDPMDPGAPGNRESEWPYRGKAFLSVPILYPEPNAPARPVGVINLTDRIGQDTYTTGDRQLIAAIANQIGAAIENARLVARDLSQHRIRHELQLAHDLQLKLLPSTRLLESDFDVGARCEPAQSVGGDFYHFLKLPGEQIGVMLGDVSSHGFSAAMIMALVLSAAGIHAESAPTPDEALRRLLESVETELERTEMHLAIFYGVFVPECNCIRYANAGHPHAFLIRSDGTAVRLGATTPPLGLVPDMDIAAAESPWNPGDLLVTFSDGIVDSRDASGEKFGEERVLAVVRDGRNQSSDEIVSRVFEMVTHFSDAQTDDRTIVVVKA